MKHPRSPTTKAKEDLYTMLLSVDFHNSCTLPKKSPLNVCFDIKVYLY